jgi:hypothetical protein
MVYMQFHQRLQRPRLEAQSSPGTYYRGYVDELRITTGVAR